MRELDVDCVIPTHGRPAYLREALRSVLEQTRPPAGVSVVADDGGAGAQEVVDELRAQHPGTDVALLRRTTGQPGASASRNHGALRGDRPVLAFLDDDDLWEPTYLESAVARLAQGQVDAVVTATRKFAADGSTSVNVPLAGLDAREAFRRNPGMTGSNVVLLRSVFSSVGGFDPAMPVQNDRDLFLRLVLRGHTYAVEREPLVRVRQHEQGRLTDATARRADGILLFEAKHGDHFGWWDRRTMRYTSHYTRMSAATTRPAFVRSAFGALMSWSPTVAKDLPLDLFRGGRVRKLVRELVSGSW